MSGTPPFVWSEYADRPYAAWAGTLVSELKTTAANSVYEYAGIDSDEWLIVGIEVAGYTPSTPEADAPIGIAQAIAVKRSQVPEGGDFGGVADVDAVSLKLHGVDGFELLRLLIGDVNVRVRRDDLKNATVNIVELGDVPGQE